MKREIISLSILCLIMLLFNLDVSASTSISYEYDASGNLLSGDEKYYEYNDANQLVRVRHNDQTGPILAEYFYDYTGQRLKKIENGVTTYYIGKHFEKQVDGAGTATTTSYYFANGERVAKKDPAGNSYYYHSDHLGGTNVITDSSGNLVERIKYYPFGEIRVGGIEKYQFTGKEKDKLTEFYYFEARYYKPEFNHFTQADTIDPDLYDPQDLNRFAYVRNNPIKLIDPSGHSAIGSNEWLRKLNRAKQYDKQKYQIMAAKFYSHKMHLYGSQTGEVLTTLGKDLTLDVAHNALKGVGYWFFNVADKGLPELEGAIKGTLKGTMGGVKIVKNIGSSLATSVAGKTMDKIQGFESKDIPILDWGSIICPASGILNLFLRAPVAGE